MQGNTILLKQDNGSYQLLRISSAQPGSQNTPGLTPTGGSTIRLQTVPAVSRFPGPTLALRKTILTQQVKQNKQNVNSHHVWFKFSSRLMDLKDLSFQCFSFPIFTRFSALKLQFFLLILWTSTDIGFVEHESVAPNVVSMADCVEQCRVMITEYVSLVVLFKRDNALFLTIRQRLFLEDQSFRCMWRAQTAFRF